MHPAVPQAAATLAFATALALSMGLRRERWPVHRYLLGILTGLAIWTLGALMRFSNGSEAIRILGFRLLFAGVGLVGPLWLLLAAHYARVEGLRRRPARGALAFVPLLVAYAALWSNDLHHLFAREIPPPPMAHRLGAWAGPFFWLFAGWSHACIAGASLLYGSAALHAHTQQERRRASVLAAASALPALSSALYLLRLLPLPYDPTPVALAVACMLLSASMSGLQRPEALPLARRDVIEHLRDGVLVADAEGRVVDANPAAECLLGARAASLREQSLAALLSPLVGAAGPQAEAALRTALADPGAPARLELETADGRGLELRVARVSGAGGEPSGGFVLLRDRTEERRYERLARRSQRLETTSALAAGIAHEVNNPLAFVRANLSHLARLAEIVEKRRDTLGPDEAEQLGELTQVVAETLEGVQRIGTIVSGLGRLARAPADPPGDLELNALVADAVALSGLQALEGVALETALAPGTLAFAGSGERLAQAVLSLLVNAKQVLAPRGCGRVRVVTHAEPGAVAVEVEDDGPGGSARPPGLGLSLASDVAREHEGTLEVLPSPLGGARFVLRLPRRA